MKLPDELDLENFEFLFNQDDFILTMEEIGEVDNPEDDFSYNVTNLCHNACAWMVKRLYEYGRVLGIDLAKYYWVSGSYEWFNQHRKEHSWVEYRDPENDILWVLDLTLAQFEDNINAMYIGELTDKYHAWSSVPFDDLDGIRRMVI